MVESPTPAAPATKNIGQEALNAHGLLILDDDDSVAAQCPPHTTGIFARLEPLSVQIEATLESRAGHRGDGMARFVKLDDPRTQVAHRLGQTRASPLEEPLWIVFGDGQVVDIADGQQQLFDVILAGPNCREWLQHSPTFVVAHRITTRL